MSPEQKEDKGSFIKGPSLGITDNLPKREMWKEIAKELNGEFKIKHDKAKVLEIHNISIPHKKWTLKVSVSDSQPLKFYISFTSSQDFNLIMSGNDFIEGLMSKFSKSKVVLGWKEFDKQYLIKSNRSDLVKKTLTKEVQKAILKHKIYSISYQTDHKANTSELVSVIQRRAGSKESMLELIEIYRLILDNLEASRIIK